MATAADTFDDRAQLVPTIREGLPTGVGSGFLAWGPDSGGVTPDAAIQTATMIYQYPASVSSCGYVVQDVRGRSVGLVSARGAQEVH